MSKENISLETLDVSKLPELLGFEQKQKDLVAENPYIEIVDNKTYEDACKRRTALLKGRTALESQDKLIASKLTAFRKQVAEKTKTLIDITLPHEEKQQTEVKRYEAEKQAEKEAKQKEEENRIAKIKSSIDKIETDCYEIIQTITFETIEADSESVNKILDSELDFEEYDLLFDQVKERVVKLLNDRVSDVTQREEDRLEKERMKQEIFDTRVNRLKEVGFELVEDMFVSKEIPNRYSYVEVLNCDSTAFENTLNVIKEDVKQSEQAKRDAELKKQKDEQFEVRKNRLAEIGFDFNGFSDFVCDVYDSPAIHVEDIDCENVYNASITEFEEILTKAKKSIQEAKEQKEADDKKARFEKRKQILLDLGFTYEENREYNFSHKFWSAFHEQVDNSDDEWFDSYLEDIKGAITKGESLEKKKKEQEYKARAKRLSLDKKVLNESIETYFPELIYESDNQETKDFITTANTQIQQLKSNLLTQLNDL